LAAVSLDDSARPVKSKTIMAVPDRVHRLAAPVFGRALEVPLRFADRETETVSFHSRLDRNNVFRAVVSQRVREQFQQRGLERLRIIDWLNPTDNDREVLAESFDERLQLALETVAEALTFFRRYVLLGRRWSFDGGASLTTYFVGSCLFAFPNVFRRWQGEQRRWRQATAVEMLNCPEGRILANQPGTDPADLVAGRDAVVSELSAMPPETGAAAALVLDGATFAEAADQLSTTERGIEGRLYRYRTARGQQRKEGQ